MSRERKPLTADQRQKAREAQARWRAKPENKAKQRERMRVYNLQAKFGLTVAQYEVILAAQGGVCAICRRARRPKEKRFPVDHDHKTKAVRGILCTYCNYRRLGPGREDPALLRRAADYLAYGAERVALTLTTYSDWGQS